MGIGGTWLQMVGLDHVAVISPVPDFVVELLSFFFPDMFFIVGVDSCWSAIL